MHVSLITILILRAPITGSVKKIDGWNSVTKASYTTSLKIQDSYPLNTMDMTTSGLKLKGMTLFAYT